VEIHHILPQAEGGDDTEDNAAPLCPSCHETYGANPVKRRFIREARDLWYEICATRYRTDAELVEEVKAGFSNSATKRDIEALREELKAIGGAFPRSPHSISIPIEPSVAERKRLGIRDLLVLVHATSQRPSSTQADLLCAPFLWPADEDDWAGVAKHFRLRFGELTFTHLAMRALNSTKVPDRQGLTQEEIAEALTQMRVEAVCMIFVDQGDIGALLAPSGELLWTGAS
jgi:hypothetical protein